MLGVQPWIRHVRLAGIANLLLGVFLIRWPETLPIRLEEGPLQRTLAVVGGLITVCAAARVLFPQRYMLLSVVNLACGIWILLSPIAFKADMNRQMTIESVAAGLALMAFARWSISESLEARDLLR